MFIYVSSIFDNCDIININHIKSIKFDSDNFKIIINFIDGTSLSTKDNEKYSLKNKKLYYHHNCSSLQQSLADKNVYYYVDKN